MNGCGNTKRVWEGGREGAAAKQPAAADQQTIKKANVPFSAILTEVLFSLEVGKIFVL